MICEFLSELFSFELFSVLATHSSYFNILTQTFVLELCREAFPLGYLGKINKHGRTDHLTIPPGIIALS